jgi:hypothetical protein
LPAERAARMVTVLDGHPHRLTFLAPANRVRCKSLGSSNFGQVGGLPLSRHGHRQHRAVSARCLRVAGRHSPQRCHPGNRSDRRRDGAPPPRGCLTSCHGICLRTVSFFKPTCQYARIARAALTSGPRPPTKS